MPQDEQGPTPGSLIRTIGSAFEPSASGSTGSWRLELDARAPGTLTMTMIAELAGSEPPVTLRSKLGLAEIDGLIEWLGTARRDIAGEGPGTPPGPVPDTQPAPQPAPPVDRPVLLGPEARAAAATYNRTRPYTSALWKRIQHVIGATADGIPGAETADRVAAFQAAHKLDVDGRVGPRMLVAMGISPVFSLDAAFFFAGRMAIDADGAPNAYNPEDTGIDYLRNAGRPGNWWGLAVDGSGQPFVQQEDHPFPGYYVSTTALVDGSYKPHDPRRYVDSTEIPYVALPKNIGEIVPTPSAKKGDLAAVVRLTAPEEVVYAIYADVAPRVALDPEEHFGEGSIALAEALGHDPFVERSGRMRAARGISRDVLYVIFPGSGTGKPMDANEIGARGAEAFTAWGGLARLEEAIARVTARRG